jgi:hypothetical protein
MYIVTPDSISTTSFINPTNQPVALFIVARHRFVLHVTAAANSCQVCSFLCGPCCIMIGQPPYEKFNEELLLDNPLHVILNKSKLAYRIYVILIANKELKNVVLCRPLVLPRIFRICFICCLFNNAVGNSNCILSVGWRIHE